MGAGDQAEADFFGFAGEDDVFREVVVFGGEDADFLLIVAAQVGVVDSEDGVGDEGLGCVNRGRGGGGGGSGRIGFGFE